MWTLSYLYTGHGRCNKNVSVENIEKMQGIFKQLLLIYEKKGRKRVKIAKQYVSAVAEHLMKTNQSATQAFEEVRSSIFNNVTPGSDYFALNCTCRNCNGVVPIKEKCYEILEEKFGWYREKPLVYFREDAHKGGPIDVYKAFITKRSIFRVGVEFETGNISSAHRAMN